MSEEGDKNNSTASEGNESVDKDDDSCSQDSSKSINNDNETEKNNKEKSEDEDDKKDDKNNGTDEKDDKKSISKEIKDEDEDSEESIEPAKKSKNNVSKKGDKSKEKSPKLEADAGKGTCLGDIPRIGASISRFKNNDLKMLHELLFDCQVKTAELKKNIKKFNGFKFTKSSSEYTDKLDQIMELGNQQLRVFCEMLDLPKQDSDSDNANQILDFLIEPKDSGKQGSGGRPKRTAAVKANNRGYSSYDDYSSDEKYKPRSRRDKGQRSNLKDDSFSGSDEEFNPSEDEERPPVKKRGRKKKKSESEDSVETPTSDDSDGGGKKKKRGPKSSSKVKAKMPAKRGRKPNSQKKTPGRKKKKVSSEDENSMSDVKGDDSSEDEPLVKKTKTSKLPTDDELKSYVKEILDGANLEEITMKTVCQKVYDHYPDFDLAHKKDFIKSTVKSLIST